MSKRSAAQKHFQFDNDDDEEEEIEFGYEYKDRDSSDKKKQKQEIIMNDEDEEYSNSNHSKSKSNKRSNGDERKKSHGSSATASKRSSVSMNVSPAAKKSSSSSKGNKMKTKKSSNHDNDDNSDDEVEFDGGDTHYIIDCFKGKDAVTDEELDKVHICVISRDGSSKQCYNFMTLDRIARTIGKGQWLQPPAFRSPLEKDLEEQLISKFGVDFRTYFDALVTDDEDEYLNYLMRGKDMYVCPICYEFNLSNQEELGALSVKSKLFNKKKRIPDPEYENPDPMLVLSNLSTSSGVGARHICFLNKKDVLDHIADAHESVDIKCIKDGTFYKNYKLREADGLVQRYLSRMNRSFFRYYWGNWGPDFLQIYMGVKEVKRGLEEGDDEDEYLFDMPEMPSKKESLKIWDEVSAPYREDDESDNFIADDDSIEEEESEDDNKRSKPRKTLAQLQYEEEEANIMKMRKYVTQLNRKCKEKNDDEEDQYEDDEEILDDEGTSSGGSSGSESEGEEEEENKNKKKRLRSENSSSNKNDDDDDDDIIVLDDDSDDGNQDSRGAKSRLFKKTQTKRPRNRVIDDDD